MNNEPTLFLPLNETLWQKRDEIEDWLNQRLGETGNLTTSVDIRSSGLKAAPVDTNLFAAGFNNLNMSLLNESAMILARIIKSRYPTVKKVLIIPEAHTRNLYYYLSLYELCQIFRQANIEVKIANPLQKNAEILIEENKILYLNAWKREGNNLIVDNFVADLILLNNDLSDGIPDFLKNITQPIEPPPQLGWWQRRKSNHFNYYKAIVEEFGIQFNIDPWLMSALFTQCHDLDFNEKKGFENLALEVDKLLISIKQKYTQYKISEKPFIIVKADAGTYGMAVISVSSADDILKLNRKQRLSMNVSKGKQKVQNVIVQEGIYSHNNVGLGVAEPVIYLFGNEVIGGFYRTHPERKNNESLNMPGMKFIPFSRHQPSAHEYYCYSVLARLAQLAASYERLHLDKNNDT